MEKQICPGQTICSGFMIWNACTAGISTTQTAAISFSANVRNVRAEDRKIPGWVNDSARQNVRLEPNVLSWQCSLQKTASFVILPDRSAASSRQFRFHIKTFRSVVRLRLFYCLSENLTKIPYLHFQDKWLQRLPRPVRAAHLFRFHLFARSAVCQRFRRLRRSIRCRPDRIVPDLRIRFRLQYQTVHCRR